MQSFIKENETNELSGSAHYWLGEIYLLKKENRELSLSEIFSKGLAWAHSAKIFDEKGVELVDNTPEEIKDLVLEMAEKLSSNNMNNDDEELQKNFKNLFNIYSK